MHLFVQLSIAGVRKMSRNHLSVIVVFALFLFGALSGARAELVYVEQLRLAPDLVTGEESQSPACDVRSLVGEGLLDVGCTVFLELDNQIPEVIVTMVYEQIGGGGWLTVSSSDVVVGRQFAERRYYVSPNEESCRIEARQIVKQVAFPPFYENNKAVLKDNVSGMEFTLIPKGTMEVDCINTTVQSFFLSRFEATQSQWEKVHGVQPLGLQG